MQNNKPQIKEQH